MYLSSEVIYLYLQLLKEQDKSYRIPFLGIASLGKYSCEEIGRYQRMLNNRYVQLNLHLMGQTGKSITNWKCRKEVTEKQLVDEGTYYGHLVEQELGSSTKIGEIEMKIRGETCLTLKM